MIEICFVLLTAIMAGLILAAVSLAANNTGKAATGKYSLRAALLLIIWLSYIIVASFAGVFKTAAMPPRIPLLLVLPVFIFIAFFFLSGRYRFLAAALPAQWLVYVQSFRIIVELLLLGLFIKGVLPVSATFEGYNFEVLTGVSALVVGYFGFRGGTMNRPLLIAWNIAGLGTLAVVVFIIISHIYKPALWHDHTLQPGDFGIFPYTYLAGFLMPLAVFIHLLSIAKTRDMQA